MQTANVNLPIVVTGRHVDITEAMRDYAHKKVQSLHLDYPRIMEARVILDVESGFRHFAEIVLHCANHITIEASTVTEDVYASIDETISKIARRMRKYKTRMLKRTHRPRSGTIKSLPEKVFAQVLPEEETEHDIEPHIIHKENYKIRPLFTDEAIMDMEMNEKEFIVFLNQKTHRLSVLYRRQDGDYGMIEPDLH